MHAAGDHCRRAVVRRLLPSSSWSWHTCTETSERTVQVDEKFIASPRPRRTSCLCFRSGGSLQLGESISPPPILFTCVDRRPISAVDVVVVHRQCDPLQLVLLLSWLKEEEERVAVVGPTRLMLLFLLSVASFSSFDKCTHRLQQYPLYVLGFLSTESRPTCLVM